MTGFVGISEIDVVLLDLYGEQELLEEALKVKPKSKAIITRHRRVVNLVDMLLNFGGLVQELSGVTIGPS